MKHIKGLMRLCIVGTAVVALASCGWGPSSVRAPQKHYPDKIPQQIATESVTLSAPESIAGIVGDPHTEAHRGGTRSAQLRSLRGPDREFSPWWTSRYRRCCTPFPRPSASISSSIPWWWDDARKLTLNSESASAAVVLNEILSAYDLHFETDGNGGQGHAIYGKDFQTGFSRYQPGCQIRSGR